MICNCDHGYVNFNNGICNYKQKKQLVAFLLALFLGEFGANWFYLGNGDIGYNGIGIIKFILSVITIMFICLGSYCVGPYTTYDKDYYRVIVLIISIIISLITIGWYLADWINIAIDPCNIKDPNGICLKSW
jgi:hypothetical protein